MRSAICKWFAPFIFWALFSGWCVVYEPWCLELLGSGNGIDRLVNWKAKKRDSHTVLKRIFDWRYGLSVFAFFCFCCLFSVLPSFSSCSWHHSRVRSRGGLSPGLVRKMRKRELAGARVLSRLWACNMIVAAVKLVHGAWRERGMCEFWNDPYDGQGIDAWEEGRLFGESWEIVCLYVCMRVFVCVFEDEADLEYEQGVEFATQSAQSADFVHVPCSDALIRNFAEFGQETRMFHRDCWSIENPLCPGQFMSTVFSYLCRCRRFILASTVSLQPWIQPFFPS
jgi:hypothetical protein